MIYANHLIWLTREEFFATDMARPLKSQLSALSGS